MYLGICDIMSKFDSCSLKLNMLITDRNLQFQMVPTAAPQTLQSLCSSSAKRPRISQQAVPTLLRSTCCGDFFVGFSKILASIKDLSKKQASLLLSCRGGLGEAPVQNMRACLRIRGYIYIHIYIYKYMYMCMCMYMEVYMYVYVYVYHDDSLFFVFVLLLGQASTLIHGNP